MTAGLVLSTLLALAPPEDGEAIVVASEPAPPVVVVDPTPAPAPAPAPAPTMTWAPAADTTATVVVVQPEATVVTMPAPPVMQPVVPPRPGAGIGLFFSGMISFSIGVGMQLQQHGFAARVCNEWQPRGFDSVSSCFSQVDNPGNYLGSGLAFGSAIVMTSIGSAALGQREAWESNYGDGKIRNRTSRRVGGAIMLGLGIAAFATEGALLYMDWKNPCGSWECNVERRAMWLGVADVGVVGLASGFGLLSWSGQYGSRMSKYQRMRFAFAPSATPHSLGAKVGIRF
jgi:hypothetical protein